MLFLLASLAFGGVDVVVPVPLQATLLVKVAAYDRASPGRNGGVQKILVLERDGDVDSARIASQMKTALDSKPDPKRIVEVAAFVDAASLATRCAQDGVYIVYLATSLSSEEAKALGVAFTGRNVLTVSAEPSSVADGAVLAFDLVSGQTKILVNLPQARLQGVDFDASLLAIAKVYQ